MKKNRCLIFVLLVVILPLSAFYIMKSTGSMQPLPFYGEGLSEHNGASAPRVKSFRFVNQDGLEINGDFTRGKLWIACYFFTSCPAICPKMIAGMKEVQQRFRNEPLLKIVSFTVDPERDTPYSLKNYARNKNIDSRQWNLVTGTKMDLYRYARKELKLVASDGDGGPNDFIHSERLVLLDKQSRIRGYYDGTEPSEIKLLIKHIEKLLKEK